jgi:hypothetical protein
MLKIRHLLVAGFLLASMKSNACHIEYYTSTGCLNTSGPLTIGAYVAAAGGDTYYQWQFRAPGGSWTYLLNGNRPINGGTFAVSNSSSGPSSSVVPTLTITNPTIVLDNVQFRVVMRVGQAVNSVSITGSTDVYNADDVDPEMTKYLRIRYAADGSCQTTCDDNLLSGSSFATNYGGFEMVSYSNGNFTNNNFAAGRGSSDYDNGGTTAGSFKVMNNPYAAYGYTNGRFAPHSGNYQMIIKGSTDATDRIWYKTVTATAGQQYTFSAWVAGVDATASNVKLYAGSTEIGSVAISSTSVGSWVQVTGTYNVPTSGSIVFSIKNSLAATNGADNFVIDDICLTAIPGITIGDYVWADINRDGIQDGNEDGIAGVTVKLWVDANNDNNADNANPYATATTNAAGAYTFTNVPRGKYFVQFPTTVTGYTGLTTQNAGVEGSNSAANVTTGKSGTHDFNADYLAKDAGYLKNITITGKAFNDPTALIDNTVNGTAISSVSGSALYANLFNAQGFVASTPVAAGAYTFSNLKGNAAYTVAISTVAAVAGNTASSTLPSGWMNTGENIGTGTGSDGTANGLIAVALTDASVANVNFGMQQPPTANVTTLPSQANPGGVSFITVPPTNFGGMDEGGTISAIKITGFPTNATTIKVNGVDYTSATISGAPNVPTNATGQPTQPIAVDPIDGNVSVVIPYKTIDNGGAQSSNTGSVTVPVVVPPDLSPVIIANPSVMNGITNFNITIKVAEVGEGTATSGLITVLVPKDPRISFTYNNGLTTIGSTPVNNANWSLDNSNQFFYIFTSTSVIPASGFSTIGLAAQFNPQSAQGVYVLSSVIKSGSGSEVRTSNNSSSVSLTYFPN